VEVVKILVLLVDALDDGLLLVFGREVDDARHATMNTDGTYRAGCIRMKGVVGFGALAANKDSVGFFLAYRKNTRVKVIVFFEDIVVDKLFSEFGFWEVRAEAIEEDI
jgi:hypothetical protein